MTTALMEDKDTYLAAFSGFERAHAGDPAALVKLRQEAMERFAALGFPTTDDEEWRFTPLAPLTRTAFELPTPNDAVAGRSRFVAPALPAGVVVCPLAEALAKYPEQVLAHLARYAEYEEQPFVALNTAFLHDGLFVYLPAGKVVAEPIELQFVPPVSARPLVWHRRVLVVAERGSQATLVERYTGPAETPYFTSAVTEIVVGDEANIDHYKAQEEGSAACHVATTQVRMSRGSKFRSHAVHFGGRLVRNDVNAYLAGEGCECTLNGLSHGHGEQLIDNHTRIDHAKPHCASHELYKTILDGKAHGVFNGKIYVHLDAQKTDAKQTNQALLLSPDAVIDTKPQLEIFADDVKCTHGATVGQLDPTQVYYLRSRGIGEAEARALLTFAFANDIVERIQVEALRSRLEERLLAAHGLPAPEAAKEAV